jgi:hypothetical protein
MYLALRTAVREHTESGNEPQLSETPHPTGIVQWQPSNEIVRQFEIEDPNEELIMVVTDELE